MGKRKYPITDPRKCKEHNVWKKKNKYHPELGAVCELCRMRLDEIQKQNELTGGSSKPPVKITKY